MDWVEDLEELSLVSVHRLDMMVPSTDVDAAMARMLPELSQAATLATLTPSQEADLVPATTLFNTLTLLAKHRADFQLYMEACLAYSKLGVGKILVTDDHKFLKIFLQSNIAEEALHTVCVKTLNIAQGVRVKLAGEVIRGV